MSDLDMLTRTLARLSPRPGLETMLALDVRDALAAAGVEAEPEAKLTCGRVDLLAGRIAVELKTQGTAPTVFRQLQRYAKDTSVDAVVLVTARAKLRSMPREINGKPLRVVYTPRL